MRSRYSAFVRGDRRYLERSQESPAPLGSLKKLKWLGLKILEVKAGESTDEEGEVLFEARYRELGQVQILRERSLFRRLEGRWLYIAPISSPSR